VWTFEHRRLTLLKPTTAILTWDANSRPDAAAILRSSWLSLSYDSDPAKVRALIRRASLPAADAVLESGSFQGHRISDSSQPGGGLTMLRFLEALFDELRIEK
jgi:hypothetical protein